MMALHSNAGFEAKEIDGGLYLLIELASLKDAL